MMVPGVCHALPAQLDGQAQRGHAQHAAVVVLAGRAHVHVQRAQEPQLTCKQILTMVLWPNTKNKRRSINKLDRVITK